LTLKLVRIVVRVARSIRNSGNLGSETSTATDRVPVAGRDVIAIDRAATSKSCCLDGRNWQITISATKF